MSKQHDSEGFMSTPLEGAGARPKDNYYQDGEDNEVRFREADDEYQHLKADLHVFFYLCKFFFFSPRSIYIILLS